jgi:hypothetical protein
MVSETDDDEADGQHDESEELDGLSADRVNSRNRDPVTWDGATENDDQVSKGNCRERLSV